MLYIREAQISVLLGANTFSCLRKCELADVCGAWMHLAPDCWVQLCPGVFSFWASGPLGHVFFSWGRTGSQEPSTKSRGGLWSSHLHRAFSPSLPQNYCCVCATHGEGTGEWIFANSNAIGHTKASAGKKGSRQGACLVTPSLVGCCFSCSGVRRNRAWLLAEDLWAGLHDSCAVAENSRIKSQGKKTLHADKACIWDSEGPPAQGRRGAWRSCKEESVYACRHWSIAIRGSRTCVLTYANDPRRGRSSHTEESKRGHPGVLPSEDAVNECSGVVPMSPHLCGFPPKGDNDRWGDEGEDGRTFLNEGGRDMS